MRASIKKSKKNLQVWPELRAAIWRTQWFSAAGLCLLTLLVYIPTYKAGFIWDDDVLASNALLNQGWQGLRDIWFSAKFGDYVPMTATTFWIEWQIHGAMKEIQHATNIVFQACNVVLLWRVLIHLRIRAAWLVAAVFAVHPVCVASVTWLAERKNTLSMFFYLLSLLCFLRSETKVESIPSSHKPSPRSDTPLAWSYFLSFVFFLLALLSKSSAVVLPVVMLLCLWWRNTQIGLREFRRVAPFFIFAFVAGIVTLVGHHLYAPKSLTGGDDLLVRILAATRAVWFYLGKDFWPTNLTLHYPRWKIESTSTLHYLPGLALMGIFILFWRFRRSWGRACFFGFGYYIVALGPTLGVLDMAFLTMGQVADHFQYLALPGIIALLVGGTVHLFQRWPQKFPLALAVFFSVLLLVPLAFLSWEHQRLMADPEALWQDNIKKNPASWVAHNNYGGILAAKGQFDAAIPFYREALKKQTALPVVQANLGRALVHVGQSEEAVAHYSEAVRLKPYNFKTRNDLGIAFLALGKTNEAISCFEKAAEGDPSNDTFFSNLIRVLVLNGEIDRASQTCHTWLRHAPTNSLAHEYAGQLSLREGNLELASSHYKEAVRLDSNSIEARAGLEEVLTRQHKLSTERPKLR